MKVFSINPVQVKLPWEKFKVFHEESCKADPLTAEQRYEKLGGKIPKTSKGK